MVKKHTEGVKILEIVEDSGTLHACFKATNEAIWALSISLWLDS